MSTQSGRVTRRRLTGFVLSTVVALSTFLPYIPVEATGTTVGTSGTMDATGSSSGAGGGLYDIDTPPFRVGIMRDSGFYNDGTPEMGRNLIKQWSHRYPNNKDSIYFLPYGGRPVGQNLEVGKYDASSRKLLLYDNASQLNRVRRLDKKTDTPTNPAKAYLKAYSYTGSKKFGTLQKGKWKTTIASKFTTDKAENMWAYVFTPNASGKYAVSGRMEQAISSYADEFNSNDASETQKNDVARGYLGMLIGTWKLVPSDQRGPWESAIEDYLTNKNQNKDSKVASIVVDTAVTMQLVKRDKFMIFPTYDYFQYYTALGSNNSLYNMTASKLGSAVGDTYDTLIKVVQRDIKDAPKTTRISNVFNAENAFSWGASAIVYPDMRFGSAYNNPKWTPINIKAAVMDVLKLGTTDNGAVRGFVATGSMAVSVLKPEIYKNKTTFTALDDNKKLPAGAKTVGVKTRLMFQKKADQQTTNSWANLFKNNPTENKEITVKITPNRLTSPSQTSGASYTSALGNFTTGVKMTRSQFMKFIGGSLKIQMEDNTVNEKVSAGTTKTFTYSPKIEIKYTLDGKAQTWTETLKDTASYKASPAKAPADPTLKATLASTPDKKEVPQSQKILGEKTKLTIKHTKDANNSYLASWDKIFNYNKTANSTLTISAVPSRASNPETAVAPSYTSVLGNSFATKTGISISKADFRSFISGDKSLVIEDNTTNIGIEDNKTNTYAYGIDLKVSFTVDGKKHTVMQTIKNPASFFKGEYVTDTDLGVTPTTDPDEQTCEELNNCTGDPETDNPATPPDTSDPPATPEKVPYMGFTSDPRAYSELKEGSPDNEKFEAMSGVPSNKRLYLGVGGDEFVVDVELEYKKDVESVWRTYRSYFTGTPSEFKDGDTAKGKSLGGQSVDTHHGGTYTKTWSGSIPNKGTSASGTGSATSVAVPDRTAYNKDKAEAQAYANTVNSTTLTHTAASDKVTRSSNAWGAAITTDSPNDPQNNTQTASHQETYGCGTKDDPGKTCTKTVPDPVTASPSGAGSYTIIVTFKVPAHVIDGPECEYDLPMVEDNWKQKIKFDYLKIVRADVYKIEEGKLTRVEDLFGESKDTLSAKIKSGDPKMFVNIAQKNAGGDDVKAQSSKYGRLRYTLEENQHDTVVWNEGVRSNKSAGQGRNGSSYAPQGGGHNNSWSKGILYNNPTASTEKDFHRNKGGTSTTITNSADGTDTATPEWKKFDERRKSLNKATVISDMLILQTSSGDQSVIYFDKDSETIQSQEQFKEMDVKREDMWENNVNSAAKWQSTHINMGSYNGMFKNAGSSASDNKKYWGYSRENGSFIDNSSGGSRSQVITRFDSNGVGVDGATSRPSRPSKMYLYGDEDIIPTTPNGAVTVGETSVFYKNLLFWESPNAYENDPEAKSVRSFEYASEVQDDFNGQQGLILDAPYSKDHDKTNDVIIHTPVTVEDAMIVGLDKSLDQRTELPSGGAASLIDEQNVLQNEYNNSQKTDATFDPAIDTELTAKTTISTVRTTKSSTQSTPSAKGTKTYSYVGNTETFTAPETGDYVLETWGARGGNRNSGLGGLGGYAKGTVKLTKGDVLTIKIGGKGTDNTSSGYYSSSLDGGYNGGGRTGTDSDGNDNGNNETGSSGGGYSIIKKGTTTLIAGGGGGGVNYSSAGGSGSAGGGGGGSYGNSGSNGSGMEETGNTKIGGDALNGGGGAGTGYTNTLNDTTIQSGVSGATDGNGKAVISYDIQGASNSTETTENMPVKESTDVSNSSVGDKDGFEGWTWEQLFGVNWRNYISSKTTSTSDSSSTTTTSTYDGTDADTSSAVTPSAPFAVQNGFAVPYGGYGGSYSFTLSSAIKEGDTIIIETLNGNSENNTSYVPTLPSDFVKVGSATDGRQVYKKTAVASDKNRTLTLMGGNSYGFITYTIPAGYSPTVINSGIASYPYETNGSSIFVVSAGSSVTNYNGYTKASISDADVYENVLYKEVVSNGGNITLPTFSSFHNSNVPHILFTNTGVSSTPSNASTGTPQTFTYKGSKETYTAPDNGTYKLEVYGAQGGGSFGGKGGYTSGEIKLSQGDVLNIYAGGTGSTGSSGSNAWGYGGFNGGGNGYGDESPSGGGGASDIRLNGVALTNRVIVAGGGGGQGRSSSGYDGGAGGGLTGSNGIGQIGGEGGSQTKGGSSSGYSPLFGQLGIGGSSDTSSSSPDQGGGGGGYYGGEAGGYNSNDGGGGGGSSYFGTLANATTSSGVNTGDGKVVITPLTVDKPVTKTSITDVVTTKVDTTEVKTVTTVDETKVKTDLATFPDKMPDGTWNPVKLKFGAGEPLPPSPTTTPVQTSNGSVINLATFLTMDREFKVYFPNAGDFAQRPDMFGIDSLTLTRGKGFVNNMDVTQYMSGKRVKFSFNVIFDNELYTAGSWIALPLNGDYYDFYAVLANKEQSGAEVEFDTVAINGSPSEDPDNDNMVSDTNKDRLADYTSYHGGYKKSYIDLIGRIGNFVVSDTEDFRFSNLFKKAKPDGKDLLDGLVKEVDPSQQNQYYGDLYDLRGVAVNSTGHRLNTYGTQTWLEKAPLSLPINPKDNANKALKEQFMKPGYDILADITTTGNYSDGVVRALPYYYKLDIDSGKITPLDAYLKDGDSYKVVNKYRGADDGNLPTDLYKYDLSLDWENEAPRRNFSLDEATITKSVSEVYGEYITGFVEMPGTTEKVEGVIGVDPLTTPKGNFVNLGTAQRVVSEKGARTFIGTTKTYGVEKQLNQSVPTSEWNYAVQRWHLKLGLPSSTVFVESGKAVTQENMEDVKKGNAVMLMSADIVSVGNLFSLRWEQKGVTSFDVTKDGKTRNFDISSSGLPPVVALYDLNDTAVVDIEVKGSH